MTVRETTPVSVFWPWLYVASLALPILYGALWLTEIYLFILAVLTGGSLFIVIAGGRLIFRAIRGMHPWIDRPAVLLIAVMFAVHVATVFMLRSINWC